MEDIIPIIEKLFFQHHKMLCNIANNIINDKAGAEDIVQDVFLKLWKNKEKVDWSSSMKSYLYRAVTNGALNWLNKNRKNIRYDTLKEPLLDSDSPKTTPEEIKNEIEVAINTLAPKCKAIFILNRYEGLKYKEIANYLNISVKTVENQMSIALKKLREKLKPTLLNLLSLVITLLIKIFGIN